MISPLLKSCAAAILSLAVVSLACQTASARISLGESYIAKGESAPGQMTNEQLKKESPTLDTLIHHYKNGEISHKQFVEYVKSADEKYL